MMGMWRVQSPHAALYPVGRAQQSGRTAREAGSQPVRGRILAHAVPTPHAPLAVGQLVRSHIFAHHVAPRTHFLFALSYSYHSNGGMGAFLHPNDGNAEPVDSVRAAENRSSMRNMLSYFVFSWGVWGLCPHVNPWPLTFVP